MAAELIEIVEEAWGWTGLSPRRIVGSNDFGNLMIEDREGRYWRLCPEDLCCEVVAEDRPTLDSLAADPDFLLNWSMTRLVEQASASNGPLKEGHVYCLRIPGVLGGEYGGSNLAMISIDELIAASGSMARQIADLPDGSRVRLSVME